MRSFLPLAVLSLTTAAASAQCTPHWDYSIPGVNPFVLPLTDPPVADNGYVGAMFLYQGDIIASGSFKGIGAVPNTKYLARYNIATNSWSAFGAGLGDAPSNSFGTSFAEMNGDLYVGGFYADANGVPDTKSISRWDGTEFHSLGTGWAFNSVNQVQSLLSSSAIGGPRVYIGGGFDNIAGQPAANIAMWDGTTLTPLATTMNLVGINAVVFSMAMFDDGQGGGPQLYIGGRFADIDGVVTKMIARWNGTTWSGVGTNLGNTIATGEIDSMLVWDDGNGPALYISGNNIRVDGVLAQVAKWNGVTWTAVGQNPTGRVWTLATFDDGSGEKLYAGGTASALGRVFRLEGNVWTTVEGGADGQVIRLFNHDNRLYMGGSFANVNALPGAHIVARTSCLVTTCPADLDNGSGTGTSDGGVDINDLLYFLGAFEAGTAAADLDNGSGTGTPDGGVDINDLLFFLTHFEAGC